jgi:hypothetical protein
LPLPQKQTMKHVIKHHTIIGLTVLAILAGCAGTPKTPEPAAEASARPRLTGLAAKAEVQKILRQSVDWLDAGEAEKAQVELEYAQQLEPDNKQVSCLLRGITADPLTVLGKESTAYTVRPGESLGQIARRAMGDVCEFYLLARYNQIQVPKQLAAGQTIRIPGRVVLAPLEALPVPRLDGNESVKPKSAVPAELDVKARRALIDNHHRNAQTAYRNQDLTTAIREWDAVLAIDPKNAVARERRQEALGLQRRFETLGK